MQGRAGKPRCADSPTAFVSTSVTASCPVPLRLPTHYYSPSTDHHSPLAARCSLLTVTAHCHCSLPIAHHFHRASYLLRPVLPPCASPRLLLRALRSLGRSYAHMCSMHWSVPRRNPFRHWFSGDLTARLVTRAFPLWVAEYRKSCHGMLPS